MKHILLLSLAACALASTAAAQEQSQPVKPDWITEGVSLPYGVKNSVVKSFFATGNSIAAAQEKARKEVWEERVRRGGVDVAAKFSNGESKISGGSSINVRSGELDEYWEFRENEYKYYLLAQIAINSNEALDNIRYDADYGFSGRAFVPGWAQIHKGSTGKGIFFITGEAALIVGVAITEGLRSSYESKIGTTHDAKSKQTYTDNADTYGNVRNVLIAGAAALYVWNVIDGIAAKGKKHVIVIGKSNLQILPYASTQSGGIALSLNF